jgi:hypothetical protein
MSAPVSAQKNLYRFSVLATAFVRMWRAWRILLPVVVVNALVQAALLIPGLMPYLSVAFGIASLLSFVVLVFAFGAVTAAMLQAAQGTVDYRWVWEALRARWLSLLLWSLALVIALTIGLSLYVLPGFAVLAATPYLLLAVVDGRSRPLRVNFQTIGARWGRWLVTIGVLGILCLIMWVLALVDSLFVGGASGSLIGWIVLGLVAGWFICTWALIYQSVKTSKVIRIPV